MGFEIYKMWSSSVLNIYMAWEISIVELCLVSLMWGFEQWLCMRIPSSWSNNWSWIGQMWVMQKGYVAMVLVMMANLIYSCG